jgi:hypothetical protein
VLRECEIREAGPVELYAMGFKRPMEVHYLLRNWILHLSKGTGDLTLGFESVGRETEDVAAIAYALRRIKRPSLPGPACRW